MTGVSTGGTDVPAGSRWLTPTPSWWLAPHHPFGIFFALHGVHPEKSRKTSPVARRRSAHCPFSSVSECRFNASPGSRGSTIKRVNRSSIRGSQKRPGATRRHKRFIRVRPSL